MIECRAVSLVLKPCWSEHCGILGLMIDRIVDSRTFARGDRRAMGLNDVSSLGSLLGLIMGMILAVFHVVGITSEFNTMVKFGNN